MILYSGVRQNDWESPDGINVPASRSMSSVLSALECGGSYRLSGTIRYDTYQYIRMQDTAEYLPAPPSLGSATGATQYMVSVQTQLHTEELMRRAAIYSSVTDSLVASLLEHIPKGNRTKIVQEQLKIKASRKGVCSAVAAASNPQLLRRDVTLRKPHAPGWPWGQGLRPYLLGPDIKEFNAKIFSMQEQHSLHRGLTSHFKVPKNSAPKAFASAKGSVHQRLGSPVHQEGKRSFQAGQQTRPNQNYFPSRTTPGGASTSRDPNWWGGKPYSAKKKAGPPKGSGRQ